MGTFPIRPVSMIPWLMNWIIFWIESAEFFLIEQYFELNLGQSNIESNIEWIIFLAKFKYWLESDWVSFTTRRTSRTWETYRKWKRRKTSNRWLKTLCMIENILFLTQISLIVDKMAQTTPFQMGTLGHFFLPEIGIFIKVPQTICFYSFPYQVVVMFVSEENIEKRKTKRCKSNEKKRVLPFRSLRVNSQLWVGGRSENRVW